MLVFGLSETPFLGSSMHMPPKGRAIHGVKTQGQQQEQEPLQTASQ